MKQLTRAQLEGRKAKAVRFIRDVLGVPDRADEVEAERLEDNAERRKAARGSWQGRCQVRRGGQALGSYRAGTARHAASAFAPSFFSACWICLSCALARRP